MQQVKHLSDVTSPLPLPTASPPSPRSCSSAPLYNLEQNQESTIGTPLKKKHSCTFIKGDDGGDDDDGNTSEKEICDHLSINNPQIFNRQSKKQQKKKLKEIRKKKENKPKKRTCTDSFTSITHPSLPHNPPLQIFYIYIFFHLFPPNMSGKQQIQSPKPQGFTKNREMALFVIVIYNFLISIYCRHTDITWREQKKEGVRLLFFVGYGGYGFFPFSRRRRCVLSLRVCVCVCVSETMRNIIMQIMIHRVQK